MALYSAWHILMQLLLSGLHFCTFILANALPLPFCLSFSTKCSPFSHYFLCPSLPCRRYDIHPVCADLQGQILSCYKENVGKTLNCSNIAALYLQCVNNVKQVGADHFNMHTYIHSHYCDEH